PSTRTRRPGRGGRGRGQGLPEFGKIARQWRDQIEDLTRQGVGQAVTVSVQSVAGQLEQGLVGLRQLEIGGTRQETLIGPVKLVADHRAPDARQVDADLMLTARMEL